MRGWLFKLLTVLGILALGSAGDESKDFAADQRHRLQAVFPGGNFGGNFGVGGGSINGGPVLCPTPELFDTKQYSRGSLRCNLTCLNDKLKYTAL